MNYLMATPDHKRWLLALTLVGLVSLAWSARAQDVKASDELAGMLAGTSSLQGRFAQRQHDNKGVLLAQTSGRFGLLRPGYFFWHVESPDLQSVIATPDYLWHHDLDLETVTRRPVTESSAMSPLQILGADAGELANRFIVEREGDSTYLLTPRESNAAFESLRLTLAGSHIEQLHIVDSLSQQIDIQFTAVSERPALALEDFAFTPPPGADVFYYDD